MTTDPDRLLDLLAAHDAGLPVDPAVLDDPRARRMLDALAATRAELAAVPPSSPPPELTARWSAALTGAAQDTARADPGRPPQPVPPQPEPQSPGPQAAGPLAAGPQAAGPQAAGPQVDGLQVDGLQAAGPLAAGQVDGPLAAGPPAAGQVDGQQVDGPQLDGPQPTPPGEAPGGPPGEPRLDKPPPDRDAPVTPTGRAARRPGRTPHRPPAPSRAGLGPVRGGPPVGGDRGPERGTPGGRSVEGTTVGPTPDRTPSSAARPGSATRGPRRGGRRPRPAVVAGLLLAVVLVVAGVLGTRPDRPSVTAAQLGGIARAAVGVRDAGALADPLRRAACLRAVAPPGLAPDAPLAGSRTVVFEGHPGVILLLITGRRGVLRAVVVDPGCGAGGGTLLADTSVGG